MKSVFTYLDYRLYLRDFYEEKKKIARFSYREFSRMAGFSSPVFIKLVIEGKSSLRKSSIPKISQALGLIKKERLYFRNLVLFNQARTVDEKMSCLSELKKITSSINIQALSDDKFEYFSEWYHSVMRELLNIMKSGVDYGELGRLVRPAIPAQEAEKSVALLRKLGMIREEADGAVRVTDQFVSSRGVEMSTLAVRSFQRKMTLLAADAIDNVPKDERNIS
jgi:uncharacterized protein (TIGR02147 family)